MVQGERLRASEVREAQQQAELQKAATGKADAEAALESLQAEMSDLQVSQERSYRQGTF